MQRLLLISILRNYYPSIQGKCSVTIEELDRAERAATHMLRLTGLDKLSPPSVDAAFDERNRSFTLFVQAYDDIRRALTYLRWKEDDVESIAPSLYGGRKRKSRDEEPKVPIPVPVHPIKTEAAPEPAATEQDNPNYPGASPFLK